MKKLLENKKMLAMIGGSAAVVVLAVILLVYNLAVLPNQRYEAATKLFAEGNYAEAYEAIQKVPEKKNDTGELLPYYEAYADFSAGNYASAAEKFEAVGAYEDSVQMAGYCRAVDLMEQKKYSEAYGEFAALGEFKDSQDMLKECPYRLGQDLMADGEFEEALSRFTFLAGYKDSDGQAKECSYQLALAALERKEYGEAYNGFAALGEHKDSKEMLSECRYRMAGDLMAAGDLAGALERYDALAGYKDSADQAKECRYQQAAALAAQQTVDAMTQAQELYGQLGDYKDAAAQVTTLAAAIEEASRVPYTPSSEAYFDVYCTSPDNLWVKPYKFAVRHRNDQRYTYKIFAVPSAVSAVYHMKLGYDGTLMDGYNADIGSYYISDNKFSIGYYSNYRVTGGWKNGTSASWTEENTDKVYLSAVRWDDQAITFSGLKGDTSSHSSFRSRAISGKVVDDFAGMVGGAIRFGEYDYIDLGTLYFSEVRRSKDSNKVWLKRTNGVEITVNNSCTGGEVTETYKGIDIYTYKQSSAYIHIKPDVYIECYVENNAAKARQTLRKLIDNYHHL